MYSKINICFHFQQYLYERHWFDLWSNDIFKWFCMAISIFKCSVSFLFYKKIRNTYLMQFIDPFCHVKFADFVGEKNTNGVYHKILPLLVLAIYLWNRTYLVIAVSVQSFLMQLSSIWHPMEWWNRLNVIISIHFMIRNQRTSLELIIIITTFQPKRYFEITIPAESISKSQYIS